MKKRADNACQIPPDSGAGNPADEIKINRFRRFVNDTSADVRGLLVENLEEIETRFSEGFQAHEGESEFKFAITLRATLTPNGSKTEITIPGLPIKGTVEHVNSRGTCSPPRRKERPMPETNPEQHDCGNCAHRAKRLCEVPCCLCAASNPESTQPADKWELIPEREKTDER